MIEIVSEFVVKEEARDQFELVYGPGGAWSKLFARSPGFRGTTLLRDEKNPLRYLTIDFWDTIAQRDQMLTERKAEYASLQANLTEWTVSKAEVGIFRALAEAAVRPPSRARGKRTADARRRSRRQKH